MKGLVDQGRVALEVGVHLLEVTLDLGLRFFYFIQKFSFRANFCLQLSELLISMSEESLGFDDALSHLGGLLANLLWSFEEFVKIINLVDRFTYIHILDLLVHVRLCLLQLINSVFFVF